MREEKKRVNAFHRHLSAAKSARGEKSFLNIARGCDFEQQDTLSLPLDAEKRFYR